MKNNFNKAFTLVELIVVITILAVLATVAFISFQGYTSSSRDSVRLADLKNISKSFEINRTKDIDFPLPDKKVDISSSGTIFQYQGELSQNILEKNLNIFDGGLDPVTKNPYGYAVNLARNKFQIIGFLENNESVANISQITAFADNTDKYVKSSGDTLGILLDETTNEVITSQNGFNEIDLNDNINNFNAVIFNNNIEYSSGIIKSIQYLNQNITLKSCKSILENNQESKDGYYIIENSFGKQPVYCDMTTDGGGWTLFGIYSNNPGINPIDFFQGVGFPTAKIENYNNKINWSYNLDKIVDKSLEMLITIQTENNNQGYLAESTQGMDYYNGILGIPDKNYLFSSDEELNNQTPLNIQHKCDIDSNWEQTLDYIEMSYNAHMQFSTEDSQGTRDFENDIWHWNEDVIFYYRPQYTYCDTNSSINPGDQIQAIFWIR